jgi:hypothetical protein
MVICCAMFFGFSNAFSATLTAGYTGLEYIESTGTQWLNTGVELSFADINFDIKFEFVSTQGTQGIFGYLNNSISTTNFYLTKSSTNTKFIFASGTNAQDISYSVQSATPYTIVLNDSNLKINGTSFNVSRGNLSSGNEIYLFNRNNSQSLFVGKIYYFKIYNGDTLVRDFVPAKNPSNVIGMYDTVNNVFYTNQGTGEFTAGPVVLNPCRNLFDENSNLNTHIPCAVVGNYPSINATTPRPNARTYFMTVKPNTTYTISMSSVGDRLYVFGINDIINPYDYTADNRVTFNRTILSYQSTIPTTVTFTTNSTEKMVAVYYALENIPTHFQIEEGSTATAYAPYCVSPIKIATTAYNSALFSPVQTDLNSAVATIREIVTKTINQTAAIASLQADKQTRPEDACPAGKKCLLVETEENGVIVPHWFPIIEASE